MKRLIAFVLRLFLCLAGNHYSNIRYVSKLTVSPLNPLLSKMLLNLTRGICQEFHSQYQIIITIFTLCKNNLEMHVAYI